ncbi:MAG: hypothetical protein E6600_18380 [Anaerocolumna aminovalerica]|uniref:hypothetical protein n=1 Tax=Anaerocolumna aminovalerica TaxID=1527 RepID=UPI00290BBAB4|nr:hypothetical protein [Anaerocolumna aminovalerica]MDU6266464.1 hypothetical protein [Anaerocolumna aminovalerica]
MKKKSFSILIALCLIFTLSISSTCFAATINVNVPSTPSTPLGSNEEITLQGLSKPSEFVNISGDIMEFGGSTVQADLYLEKGFTGVKEVAVTVRNELAQDLTVYCYRVGIAGNDVLVDTHIVPGNLNALYGISNLSSNSKYYLRFIGPAEFTGKIKAVK